MSAPATATTLVIGGSRQRRAPWPVGCRLLRQPVGWLGNDRLTAGHRRRLLSGGHGNDIFVGGPGIDSVHGGAGDDYVRSSLGNDLIFGGVGNDGLSGDGGNDLHPRRSRQRPSVRRRGRRRPARRSRSRHHRRPQRRRRARTRPTTRPATAASCGAGARRCSPSTLPRSFCSASRTGGDSVTQLRGRRVERPARPGGLSPSGSPPSGRSDAGPARRLGSPPWSDARRSARPRGGRRTRARWPSAHPCGPQHPPPRTGARATRARPW